MRFLRGVPHGTEVFTGPYRWLLGAVFLLAPLAVAPCLAQTAAAAPPADIAASTVPAAPPSSDSFSTQIYGILDSGVRHIDRASKAGAVTQFASGLNTSRFGFRGIEKIDSDFRASFRLEDGFNSGTGTQSNSGALFDRSAIVGLGWRNLDLKLGRQEGFGYELAASGATDPLSMALNLPNPASPAAAGSKAPVLGANPLQALYSYTYGQLRFNNVVRVSTDNRDWSAGLLYALGGVAGSFSADTVRAGHVGVFLGPTHWEAIFQQSADPHGNHSTLGVIAGAWDAEIWKIQAGLHDMRIDAGFDSTTLGNGASGSGILGSSTTVATTLAGTHQNFRFTIADLGGTWKITPKTPLTLAAYKTRSEGAADGHSIAIVALGKWYLSRRTALYLEADHAVSSGALATRTVSTGSSELAYMTGINVRF
jgi:predicted porin